MTDLDALRRDLVGRELATGTYEVTTHQAWLTADCFATTARPDGLLHPMHVFLASLTGPGYAIDELWSLADVCAEDGPMIGEMDLEQRRAIRVGERFEVRSTITDLVRKRGGSGVFDLLTVEVRLVDEGGEVAGIVRNTHVYPRAGDA